MTKSIKIILILLLTLLMSMLTGCGSSTISEAVEDGDLETVKRMLDKDPSLLSEGKGKSGRMLLNTAAMNNQIQVMELLLERGMDLEEHVVSKKSGYIGPTAFLLAVRYGKIETMEWFIKKGANIHAKTGQNERISNAINMAVSDGSQEKFKRLLQLGVEVGTREKGFYNPLISSVYYHNLELTRLLLKNGATLTVNNKWKNTLLHLAVREDDPESSKLLIEHGADVNAHDKYGRIPLHNMLYWRRDLPELTALLLEKGSEPDARDRDGDTPLHNAAKNRFTQSARLLLEKGADVGIQGYMNRRALKLAIVRGARGVQKLMISLHTASAKENLEKVKELYAKYPQLLNSRDEDERTPLHHAAAHNRRDIAGFLIEKGADIHAVSQFRRVHLVHGVIAQLLVPKNGRVKRFFHNKTPLGMAVEQNHAKMAEFLKSKGAKE